MDTQRGKGHSFAKRIYLPRIVGVGIGCFSVIAALYPLAPPVWLWLLLAGNVLVWPHVAYQLSSRSPFPYRAERRNILGDSLMGGFWAATIQFNPLVTVVMLGLMAMHNAAAGGPRLMALGAIVQALGIVLSWLIFSPGFDPTTTQTQIYACLPVLVLYPIIIGIGSFQVASKLAEHKRALSALSRTDSLTGLLNHGSWKDLLNLKFQRCREGRSEAVIALIDIDHFKAINDTFGHLIGDGVLRQLSQELRAHLRDQDLGGRYGGDEFCVIMPNMPLAQASEVMERLRQGFSDYRHSEVAQLRVTLSIGLATCREDFSHAGDWLHEADKALYVAKNTGRNKICSADPSPATQQPCPLANTA